MTEISNKDYTLKLIDGILVLTWHTEKIDYDMADEGIKNRLQICNGNPYPMLSDIRKIKSISKDAKNRLSKPDGETNLTALAVIYEKSMFKYIILSYQLIYSTNVTAKCFTSIKKANEWLQQFKNK